MDALTHFHAPDQSLSGLSQRALNHQGPLAPALDNKRTQLLKRTAELRSKAREIDACLQVRTHSWTCKFHAAYVFPLLLYVLSSCNLRLQPMSKSKSLTSPCNMLLQPVSSLYLISLLLFLSYMFCFVAVLLLFGCSFCVLCFV